MTNKDYEVWMGLVPSHGSPKPESQIGAGFWRRESGINGNATPVATWCESGMWMAVIGDSDPIDPDCGEQWFKFLGETWSRLKAYSEADYNTAMETGVWPDHVPVAARGGMGDNNPPDGSTEALLIEARDAIDKAKSLVSAGAAKDQDAADIAANVAKSLTELKAKIIAAHKVEKDPHLQAGRAVDDKFFPLRDGLVDFASALKGEVVGPYLIEQKRRADEAIAMARKEALEKAAAEAKTGDTPPDAIPAIEASKVTSGARGRKVSLVDVKRGKIEDASAFAAWLVATNHVEMMDLLQRIANRIAGAHSAGDKPAPGVIVTVTQEAR